ncbi:FkbM family methyltransferase [Desulfovibrio sp. OttesenSCG-928-C06]|nr:FkbM family methyltransferase [Desulfovibrio sp. OttesenSCG-928-C06]
MTDSSKISVIVIGAGSMAENIFPAIDADHVELLAFVDERPDMQGRELFATTIVALDHALALSFDYILVACRPADFVMTRLREDHNIPEEKIISLDFEKLLPASSPRQMYSTVHSIIKKYLKKTPGLSRALNLEILLKSHWISRFIEPEAGRSPRVDVSVQNRYLISDAQLGEYEDMILYRFLHNVENGFYVDVGCSDPLFMSVTNFFYSRGWSGINVDPRPEAMHKYDGVRSRDINCCLALSSENATKPFWVCKNGNLSTMDKDTVERLIKFPPNGNALYFIETSMDARTLTSLLDEHRPDGDIHFLKVDVEKHEKEVLQGMDFNKYRPWMLVVESTLPTTHVPCFEEWEHLITDFGYDFIMQQGINRYYISHEKKEELIAACVNQKLQPFLPRAHANLFFGM